MQRAVLIAFTMLWLVCNARAAQFYSLKVSRDGDRYEVRADVFLDAPLPQVYGVLTDYNHLTRISSAIRRSHVVKRIDAQTYIVFIESRACVLFFCHNIREMQRVIELTPRRIIASAIPQESNVKMASDSWHLKNDSNGTRMRWKMTLVPNFWIPPVIGPVFVEGEMRAEGQYTAEGVEKLARERAHLPPLPPSQ